MSGKELAFLATVMVLWFALNRWILPYFGVNTCMSGCCPLNPPATASDQPACQSAQQPLPVSQPTKTEQ